MVGEPVDIKGIPGDESFHQCEELARGMAAKLNTTG